MLVVNLGEASPTKPFKAKSQHFGDDTIAHTRFYRQA